MLAMDRELTTVHEYMYTDFIVDVDIHPMSEYLSELTDVGLAAFTTKLEKSSLIVSLKRDKQTHTRSHRVTDMHKINIYRIWHLRFQHKDSLQRSLMCQDGGLDKMDRAENVRGQ